MPQCRFALQSADHICHVATFLAIDDLMQCSSLSRSLHSLFDGEAVWLSRLRAAQAIQCIPVEQTSRVPESAVLSSQALAALPPPPSLSEAAALCLQAFIQKEEQYQPTHIFPDRPGGLGRPIPDPPRLSAIVHLPSTQLYHARITVAYPCLGEHELKYVQFTIKRGEEQQWAVDEAGYHRSGMWALNVEDNIGDEEQEACSRDIIAAAAASSNASISSKQRYIDLLGCSEHAHSQCYRLLSLSSTRVFPPCRKFGYLSPVCPLPLCASCRTSISRCIQRTYEATHKTDVSCVVWYVARINLTEYDIGINSPYSALRVKLTHRQSEAYRPQKEEAVDNSTCGTLVVAEDTMCWLSMGATRTCTG